MSFYVAIPSNRDRQTGFTRLGFWKPAEEFIRIDPNASASKTTADATPESGLILIGLPFLEQKGEMAKQILDVSKGLLGVFLHPGGANTPGSTDIEDVLSRLDQGLQTKLRPHVVAFTHSGAEDHKVSSLQAVWNWMAVASDAQLKVQNFDYATLGLRYNELKRDGGRDLLVELCILVQACIDDNVSEESRRMFARGLKDVLSGRGAWLLDDKELKGVVAPLQTTSLEEPAFKNAVTNFLQAIRLRFSPKNPVSNRIE